MGFVVRSHSCRCVGECFGMKVHYFASFEIRVGWVS
jgi:hypothetical protein